MNDTYSGHITPEEEEEYIKNDIKIVVEALKIQYVEVMESITVSKDRLNDYITRTSKLKLNGLYGKFGTDMNVTGKLPFF